jgi:hypothetical protein
MQSTPDPPWKWWISALAPWIGPLMSGVVSIYVAWKVFRWQGNKDRAQWILDQKKAEWQELLRGAAHMRRVVSLGLENSETRAQQIREGLKPAVLELEVSAANCVFLSDFFGDEVKSKRFYSFLRDADLNAEGIDASFIRTQHLKDPHPDLTDQQRERGMAMNIMERSDLVDTIVKEFMAFNDWLRREATEDLGVDQPEKSAG